MKFDLFNVIFSSFSAFFYNIINFQIFPFFSFELKSFWFSFDIQGKNIGKYNL